jgi:hypothetical protein
MVLVDHCVDGIDVEVLRTVPIKRGADVLEEFGQALMVVGVDPITRGSAFSAHAHTAGG